MTQHCTECAVQAGRCARHDEQPEGYEAEVRSTSGAGNHCRGLTEYHLDRVTNTKPQTRHGRARQGLEVQD